jgi:chorismate dehydratase
MYRPVQIGAVSYLNSKPLIEDLAELTAGEAELVLDYPSRLADDLAEGTLDVALIPSFEYFLHPDYDVVSYACVATHGPVMSVKLYSRVPLGQIRTLALDEGSRTSAALSRIMLAERHGVLPKLEPLPLEASTESTTADAILLIGDRAMHLPEEPFAAVWDLGEEWLAWTGLPFVFALWATRQSTELGIVESALSEARDRGVDRLEGIGHREAAALGLDPNTAIRYLRHHLHFQLGSAERSGLQLFQQLAVLEGLAPGGVNLVFRDCSDSRKSQSRRTAHVG